MSASSPQVIGIGASWGGRGAVEQLLGALTLPVGAPSCIVLHRSEANDAGQLRHILAHHAPMPVVEPDDKEPLEHDVVYIAPSGYHMLVESGRVALSVDERVRWARPSVDVLFESMAREYGDGAIAVVLTGANDDGARGAHSVRVHGGSVIVQEPVEAERREMPNAALAAVGADAEVLPLERIAARIEQLVQEPNR